MAKPEHDTNRLARTTPWSVWCGRLADLTDEAARRNWQLRASITACAADAPMDPRRSCSPKRTVVLKAKLSKNNLHTWRTWRSWVRSALAGAPGPAASAHASGLTVTAVSAVAERAARGFASVAAVASDP